MTRTRAPIEHYGMLRVIENPQAAKIWRSRHEELDPCEPFGMTHDFVTDDGVESDIESGSALWWLAKGILTDRQFSILTMIYVDGMTLDAIGRVLGVTGARILSIHKQSLRRIWSAIERQDSSDTRALHAEWRSKWKI